MAAATVHEKLVQVLDDREGVDTLIQSQQIQLSISQSENLLKLAEHFAQPEHGTSRGRSGGRGIGGTGTRCGRSSSSSPDEPKRKRTSTAKSSLWARYLRLEYISLAPAIGRYLQAYGTDATALFDGRNQDPLRHALVGFTGRESTGDAFIASYNWTVAVESRTAQDSIR
ncbi:MAG: hypothetical protein Q9174_006483 [Haloplaca sp. 1 TL-2023]